MTAHVVFTAYDADAPASISRRVTEDVIRGSIGFDGLLMSDDLAMKALAGSVAERAAAVIAAGSDVVLACNGGLQETESVAAVAPPLAGRALAAFRARPCRIPATAALRGRRGGSLPRRGTAPERSSI